MRCRRRRRKITNMAVVWIFEAIFDNFQVVEICTSRSYAQKCITEFCNY
jgi:hypothetical protein